MYTRTRSLNVNWKYTLSDSFTLLETCFFSVIILIFIKFSSTYIKAKHEIKMSYFIFPTLGWMLFYFIQVHVLYNMYIFAMQAMTSISQYSHRYQILIFIQILTTFKKWTNKEINPTKYFIDIFIYYNYTLWQHKKHSFIFYWVISMKSKLNTKLLFIVQKILRFFDLSNIIFILFSIEIKLFWYFMYILLNDIWQVGLHMKNQQNWKFSWVSFV